MDILNKRTAEEVGNKRKSGWEELKYFWYSDLYRYSAKTGKKMYIYSLLRNEAYRHTFFMRLCAYLSQSKGNFIKKLLFRFFLEVQRINSIILGLNIPHEVKIGSGFYIAHPAGIVVNTEAVIGKNCTVNQNVVIGHLKRGERKGNPTIGDNVYIAPGAVIIGKIRIGNNVVIGANSVVSRDIPDNAVVSGIPAVVISFKGSEGYIENIDY